MKKQKVSGKNCPNRLLVPNAAWVKKITKLFKINIILEKGTTMWTKPTAIDMRYGFEISMYIANR